MLRCGTSSGRNGLPARAHSARPPIHAALRHHRLMKWIARSGPFCPPSRPSWCFIGGVAPRTPPDGLAAGARRRLGREARGRSPRKNLHRGNGRTSGREPTPHHHREQATQGPHSRHFHSTRSCRAAAPLLVEASCRLGRVLPALMSALDLLSVVAPPRPCPRRSRRELSEARRRSLL